jgi:TRAP-type C4-dicarboxylate transport system substrate-binding protein
MNETKSTFRRIRGPVSLRAVVALVATLAVAGTALAKPVRIKLATLAPKGSSFHETLLEMGQEWKNAPDGGVQLTVFTDGTMGAEGDMVRRIRLGQLQGGLLTTLGIEEIEPAVAGLQSIPMAYRSLEESEWVREKMAPKLDQQLDKAGFVMLGWCDSGWWRVFSKKPLVVPDDLRGEKLLVGGGSGQLAKIVRALGAQPVELPPTDILVSLQTGLITVVPSPPVYALNGQFFQPAPHMLELNWAPLVAGIVVSKKAWSGMSPAQQEVVRSSALAAAAKITTTARAEMDQSVAEMVKRGLKVQKLEGANEANWIEFFTGIQKEARGSLVPVETYDEIMTLLAEYRATHAAPAP